MGKRKRSDKNNDTVESLLKKVKKLVRKQRRLSSSDDESKCDSPMESPNQDIVSDLETLDEIPIAKTPCDDKFDDNSQDLDPDILNLLGADHTEDKSFGENLHKDLATRWQHILLNGLPKDEKIDLLKQYLPAENCQHMKAPKLNPEVKSALGELCTKKDSYSEQKQNQMASCIAAIGKAINLTLTYKDVIPQDIIKTLGDAGRLLCDTHFRESQSRRYVIINSINKQKRDIIKNSKLDEFLFGSDLSEHLKSSKAISRSAAELKTYSNMNKTFTQPSTSTQRNSLNARGAPRMQAAAPRANPAPRRQLPPPPPPPPPPPAPRDRRREPTNARPNNYRHYYPRR